jgi:hypothetical protein
MITPVATTGTRHTKIKPDDHKLRFVTPGTPSDCVANPCDDVLVHRHRGDVNAVFIKAGIFEGVLRESHNLLRLRKYASTRAFRKN